MTSANMASNLGKPHNKIQSQLSSTCHFLSLLRSFLPKTHGRYLLITIAGITKRNDIATVIYVSCYKEKCREKKWAIKLCKVFRPALQMRKHHKHNANIFADVYPFDSPIIIYISHCLTLNTFPLQTSMLFTWQFQPLNILPL